MQTKAFCRGYLSFTLIISKLRKILFRNAASTLLPIPEVLATNYRGLCWSYVYLRTWTDIKMKYLSQGVKQVVPRNTSSVSCPQLLVEGPSTCYRLFITCLLSPVAISMKIARPELLFSVSTPKHHVLDYGSSSVEYPSTPLPLSTLIFEFWFCIYQIQVVLPVPISTPNCFFRVSESATKLQRNFSRKGQWMHGNQWNIILPLWSYTTKSTVC